MTPTGAQPAMRERSTAASVCPARLSTPPSRARSGNTCPGRRRMAGAVDGSASARTVSVRSAAEIPAGRRSKSKSKRVRVRVGVGVRLGVGVIEGEGVRVRPGVGAIKVLGAPGRGKPQVVATI
eukprot:4857759-Pyramimonas_sp.AAC.1